MIIHSSTLRSPSNLAPLKMSSDALKFKGPDRTSKFQNPFHSSFRAPRAIGPIAIIGGTASIYSAALSHTSSTLTPLSVIYLVLLALNYSIMPRISKKYVHPKTNKQSLALVEEVVKLSMGVAGFLITDNLSSLQKWTLQSSLIAAGFPSALYAIQGVLTYTAYQNLDSVTFNGLTQMKTLTAALCCFLVLGKMQSPTQMVALSILSFTPFVFQSKRRNSRKERRISESSSSKFNLTVNGSGQGVDLKKRFLWGIVPCLAATMLSGLAGAFSQKSLQMVVGSMERNPYFYSAEISLLTALCLVVSMGGRHIKERIETTSMKQNSEGTFFDHWSWSTLIPITVKASGGILTALVHKNSGSVLKGFSLVLGLVFSALLQTVLDGDDLTLGQIFGTALVLLSSWLHFTSPP